MPRPGRIINLPSEYNSSSSSIRFAQTYSGHHVWATFVEGISQNGFPAQLKLYWRVSPIRKVYVDKNDIDKTTLSNNVRFDSLEDDLWELWSSAFC